MIPGQDTAAPEPSRSNIFRLILGLLGTELIEDQELATHRPKPLQCLSIQNHSQAALGIDVVDLMTFVSGRLKKA